MLLFHCTLIVASIFLVKKCFFLLFAYLFLSFFTYFWLAFYFLLAYNYLVTHCAGAFFYQGPESTIPLSFNRLTGVMEHMLIHKAPKKHLKSIKSNQFTSFLISFVIPSLCMTMLLFAFFINHLHKANIQEKINTLNLLSSRLTAEISSAVQLSLTYIYDKDINNFYYFLNSTDAEKEPITYNQFLQLYTKSVSKNITLLSKHILGIGFISNNKNADLYFYLPKYRNIELLPLDDYTGTDWYTNLSTYNTNIFFTIPDSQENTLSVIRAVKDIDRKKILGYLTVDLSLDSITSALKELSFHEHSGILLFSPDNEYLLSTSDTLKPLAACLTPQTDLVSYDHISYEVYEFTDQTYGFQLYYLSSKKDLYADFFSAFGLTLLFYCGIMFLTSLIYLHYTKEINSSIAPIIRTMAKYNGGNPNSHCPTDTCSIQEFRMISENLNQMIEKINLHIANEYMLEIEKKNAEFQALQSEINPHFLYNTLNIFITLNRIGAKDELEKAIVSLSHLFRYTCEHQADSTIEKEFSFITDYLFLQQIRFDDRLTFEIYLEPGLEYFQIPKLLIQPLVENAVIHALEPSDGEAHIRIFAVTAQTANHIPFTILSVSNTGLPFIQKNAEQNRVGLKNIEERLRIFSPNSFFYIHGGVGQPTKSYIIIPTEHIEVRKDDHITC